MTPPTSGRDGVSWRRTRTTGAAQLVEVRERIEEVIVPKYVEVERPALPKLPLVCAFRG